MTNTLKNTSRKLLTRQQLEIINRRTIQYPLQIAEKDYHLSLAIQMVANSPLDKKLVFKGGTALHHCYLPQKRFSEDLDFTSIDTKITFEEIQHVLEADGIFQVKKVFTSDFTIKIEKLQYKGLLGQPGNIKFDVDIHQNIVFPAKSIPYKNVWKIHSSPMVMDEVEITAEKIRAISQRARYRDFYDFYFLLNNLNIDTGKAVSLLKKKEIRSPITAMNIRKNWEVAKEQKLGDLANIYCSEQIANSKINELVNTIDFKDIS